MAESLKKILTEQEKVEFTKIISDFNAAKTLDDTVDGLVRNDSVIQIMIDNRFLKNCLFFELQ